MWKKASAPYHWLPRAAIIFGRIRWLSTEFGCKVIRDYEMCYWINVGFQWRNCQIAPTIFFFGGLWFIKSRRTSIPPTSVIWSNKNISILPIDIKNRFVLGCFRLTDDCNFDSRCSTKDFFSISYSRLAGRIDSKVAVKSRFKVQLKVSSCAIEGGKDKNLKTLFCHRKKNAISLSNPRKSLRLDKKFASIHERFVIELPLIDVPVIYLAWIQSKVFKNINSYMRECSDASLFFLPLFPL